MEILGAGTCCSLDFILNNLYSITACVAIAWLIVGYRRLSLSLTLVYCSVGVCTPVGASFSLDTHGDDILYRLMAPWNMEVSCSIALIVLLLVERKGMEVKDYWGN